MIPSLGSLYVLLFLVRISAAFSVDETPHHKKRFFVSSSVHCNDQRSVTEILRSVQQVTQHELQYITQHFHNAKEFHKRRRLSSSPTNSLAREAFHTSISNSTPEPTEIHKSPIMAELDEKERRDVIIGILDLLHSSRSTVLLEEGADGSKQHHQTRVHDSVSEHYLEHLGLDIIHNSLPNNELFEIASLLPCQESPPEFDAPRFLTLQSSISRVPNDLLIFPEAVAVDQWHFAGPNGPIRNEPYGANIAAAWETFTGRDNGMVVAVADSGCSMHPDLEANICKKSDYCAGYSFSDNNANPFAEPLNAIHGTSVGGIIAGVTNNAYGISGTCWGCKLMCLKIQKGSSDHIYLSDELRALNYILEKKIKLSNNSYGGYGKSLVEYNAIKRLRDAGHLFVTASGNRGCNIDKPLSTDDDACFYNEAELSSFPDLAGVPLGPAVPSTYDLDNILTVGATTKMGLMSPFSNYGKTSVDIMAPGSNILVHYNTLVAGDIGLAVVSGTSFASPLVTATAALLWSRNSSLTYLDVKNAIVSTSRTSPSLKDLCVSGGILDAAAAVNSIIGPVDSGTSLPQVPPPKQDKTGEFYSDGEVKTTSRNQLNSSRKGTSLASSSSSVIPCLVGVLIVGVLA